MGEAGYDQWRPCTFEAIKGWKRLADFFFLDFPHFSLVMTFDVTEMYLLVLAYLADQNMYFHSHVFEIT